ncbi:FAD-binding oxidoreductase [Silicimonas algicola]|uniref:Glycine/D-amino acid oxidase-like deaminating enzyme n=1 Tax=Silicimonas algicola TaxID=1826607 RepID=A0A316G658_9RHOB|nr:FAD-binding oxidoreductase [Silicimonas algicola]AZQ67042.1 FAD-binding oxidoreductase [Silicimonas algicola]PWK55436.1 glycine/D-amino acid oxidase-like deaminating enzyme [Silicimonas algicola]
MNQGNTPSEKRTVAIVGAGIVGVSTAIWCLRDGHDVILVDRKGPAEGASHGNGGVLASCSIIPVTVPGLLRKAPRMLLDPNQPLFLKWGYLPRLAPWLRSYLSNGTVAGVERRAAALHPIIGDSLADHQALAQGTGAEGWIVPSDYVFLYDTRAMYEGDAFGWNIRRRHGIEWEVLEGDALRAYDPALGPRFQLAARCGDHGRIADPGRYVKDLAQHAVAQGARLVIGDATDVAREDGRVAGLRVSGETIPCDAVVLAAGAWSKGLAQKLGVTVPLESERGYHLELWEPSVMPRAPVMVASGKFVATPMEGRIRLAGVVEFGGLDAPASRAPFRLLERNIRAAMPGLTWKRTVEWMGHRPSVADSIPLIGEVPGTEGAYFGFGHDHVGLTGGPKTGQILSRLISGRRPNIDLSPYSPARFT